VFDYLLIVSWVSVVRFCLDVLRALPRQVLSAPSPPPRPGGRSGSGPVPVLTLVRTPQ
jgi:hypothetical protein